MPNIKSAIKRVRITDKKTLENAATKSALKTQIKKFDESLKSDNKEKSNELLNTAFQSIDKAVAKGVLHKNTASRKKSTIAKKLNKSK